MAPRAASRLGWRPGPSGARAEAPVLVLRHAAKSFGAVQALVDGSIELYPGEAHALVGENGAGKSTLVKILAGVYQPDAGSLLADGQEITLHGPAAALAAGIAVIYQEPALFPDLSVAENMFIGRQPLGSGRRIDRRAMRTEAAAIFARLGVALDPARIARGLSIADQQVVEIGKAISLEARVIVMDEPTAALSAAEVDRLFDVVRTLRAAGTAVLFISHRLEEVFALCQRVTVMRDGRQVLSRELEGLVAGDLVRAMVGRELAERPPGEQVAPGEPLLTVDRLTREGVFTDISFTVRAGEIVALAGLVGSGRSEVARAIFGIDRYDAGAVTVRGQRLRRGSPTGAMAAGVGFVPEDRRQQGLVMDMSVQQNVALASLGRLRRGGLIRASAERALATDWASRLAIKYGRLKDPVSMLSGGNQQKVVLAKWLGRKPAVLIVDEPTRGIDVATKAEVHHLLVQLARDGVGVLMISSELPEVLRISDRILVMREGRLMTELAHAEASEEEILSAATGQAHSGSADARAGQGGTVNTTLVSQSERPAGARGYRSAQAHRAGLPDQGIGHHRRPGGVRRRHGVGPAPVPQHHEHPVHPGQHHGVRAARAGRDDGRHQPQLRPVRGLGAGPVRVPVREPVRRPPRLAHPAGLPGRAGHRPGVRPAERHHGGGRPGAEPGRDAGHPVHLPRHRHPDRRRQGGGGQLAAVRLPRDPQGHRARHSVHRHRHRGGDRDRRVLPALVPLRPGAVRDGVEPGRRAAGRDPGRDGAYSWRSP